MGLIWAKSHIDCEGAKYSLKRIKSVKLKLWVHKRFDGIRQSRHVEAEGMGRTLQVLLTSQADCQWASTLDATMMSQL